MFLKYKKLLLLYLIITLTFFINLTVISASKSPELEKLSDNKFKLHISKGRIHYLRRDYRQAIKKWQPLIEHRAFSDNLRNWLNKAYGKVLIAYGHYNHAYALHYGHTPVLLPRCLYSSIPHPFLSKEKA